MPIIDSNSHIVVDDENTKLTAEEKEILQQMVGKIRERFTQIEVAWCPESKELGSGFWKLSFGPMKPITDSIYHPDHPDYDPERETGVGAHVKE